MHIWDLDQKRETDGAPEAKRARVALPKELMLTHAGHRAPVCFVAPCCADSTQDICVPSDCGCWSQDA